jgi:hypothetical protein
MRDRRPAPSAETSGRSAPARLAPLLAAVAAHAAPVRRLATLQRLADARVEASLEMGHEAPAATRSGPMPSGADVPRTAPAPASNVVSRRPIAQRLLDGNQRRAQAARCIALETRIGRAYDALPRALRDVWAADHPLVDPLHAEFALTQAPFGTDDDAQITARLDDYERRIAAFEAAAANLVTELTAVGRVWGTFEAELGDHRAELRALVAQVLRGKASPENVDDLHRRLQRKVALDSKAMSKVRERSAGEAMNRIRDYIALGYVTIDPLNTFYCSNYDRALDDFGAAAGLKNNTASGAMQWLREWEFHIHGSVTRGGGPGTAATGFDIKTGHIKPSKIAKVTGASITINDAAMLAGVVATSQAAVVRWANSKRSASVLAKQ